MGLMIQIKVTTFAHRERYMARKIVFILGFTPGLEVLRKLFAQSQWMYNAFEGENFIPPGLKSSTNDDTQPSTPL